MANYRQAKLAVDAFRGLASRIITRPEPMSRCYYTKPSFLASTKPAKRLPGFSPSFSILHNPIPQTRLQLRSYHRDGLPLVKWLHKNSSWVTLWVGVNTVWLIMYVYFHVDFVQVFKWFSGSVTKYGTFEKVPYTNRGHLLLVSSDLERKAGELLFFEGFKYNSEYRWKILPARHPESVRANVIANNIIDALKRGVNLDDKESKDSGVSHLTDLNWEVLVVDDTEYNAGCLPGGKIVVCSGLLKHYFSDAEIAMVIAHEVGHTVARHQAELVTKFLWLAFQQLVLFLHQLVPFGVLPFSSVFCFYLMVLPSWRRMEFEADHIGLILMASAGYDPRVALSMYKRLGKIYGEDSSWPDYLHSHPSMKKRKEMMAQTNIMEEALAIYRDICQSFFKSDRKYADLAGNEEMKASINAEAAIVVFTGLLKHFRSDAEIATIIGHEVGHAVARHSAEGITKNLWVAILSLVLYQLISPDFVNPLSNLFLKLPFSRRMELEADHIGLLLIASAGYDPRVAPTVYEKLGKISGGDSALRDYLTTHPSGKRRADMLARAHIMEEALTIYRDVRAGRGVEGFL